MKLPRAVVADMGFSIGCPEAHWMFREEPDAPLSPGEVADFRAYASFLAELQATLPARRLRGMAPTDDAIAAILSRLFGATGPDPAGSEVAAWRALVRSRLAVLTTLDATELDTLRLFDELGTRAAHDPGTDLDVLAAIGAPDVGAAARFSLELLPHALEATPRGSAPRAGSDGYAGLGRRGTLDWLVPTELAWDDEELARRVLDGEVLYHAREPKKEPRERIHHLLVDASASMRGDRSVFARAMALALARKLVLGGDAATLRFFDAHLYEARPLRGKHFPTAYVLSFRGERGRFPARVFAELETALAVERSRSDRDVVVHVFTHGASRIPRATLAAIRRHATITAVFFLSEHERLETENLDLFAAHWTVDARGLASPGERLARARRILRENDGAGAGSAR
jgi:hypothetical protein